MLTNKSRTWTDAARDLWCQLTHDQPMWPINGRYQCRTCLRYHAVSWEPSAGKQIAREQTLPVAGSQAPVAVAHQ